MISVCGLRECNQVLFEDAPLCLSPVIFFNPRFKFCVYHRKIAPSFFIFLLVNRMVVLFLGRIVSIRDELWAL